MSDGPGRPGNKRAGDNSTKHVSDQQELPLSCGGEGHVIAPTDRVFKPGSRGVSELPEIRLTVEKLVADAVWVMHLRKASSDSNRTEGDEPDRLINQESGAGEVELAASAPLAQSEQSAEDPSLPPSHEVVFEGMVSTLRDAFARRKAGALAQSIEAMSLADEDAGLAGLLRHAFDVACSSPGMKVDLVRELSLCGEEAASAGLHVNGAELDKRLRKSPIRRRQQDAKSGCHGHVFILAVNFEAVDDEIAADPDLIDLKLEELGQVAGCVAEGMSRDRGGPVLGAYILPRLFTHEELATVGMQELHDLPERVLRRARLNPEDLPCSDELLIATSHNGDGEMADVPLLGSARVLYLVGVSWADAPRLASGMRLLWQHGLPQREKLELAQALALALDEKERPWDGTHEEVIVSCPPGDYKVAAVGCDLFFFALRSGAQYQRGQVFIENLSDTLGRQDLLPQACFFRVMQTRAPGLPPCPSLRIYSGWLEEVAELPWPLLSFEGMEQQKGELNDLALRLGMRSRDDVTLVAQDGTA